MQSIEKRELMVRSFSRPLSSHGKNRWLSLVKPKQEAQTDTPTIILPTPVHERFSSHRQSICWPTQGALRKKQREEDKLIFPLSGRRNKRFKQSDVNKRFVSGSTFLVIWVYVRWKRDCDKRKKFLEFELVKESLMGMWVRDNRPME